MRNMILALALALGACAEYSAGDVIRSADGSVASVQYDGSRALIETGGRPTAVPAGTLLRRADNRCTFFGKFRWDETAFPECKLGEDEEPKNGYIVRKGSK